MSPYRIAYLFITIPYSKYIPVSDLCFANISIKSILKSQARNKVMLYRGPT